MSRDKSSKISNTSIQNSAADTARANQAFNNANDSLTRYERQLTGYQQQDPYAPGGEYQSDFERNLAGNSNAIQNSVNTLGQDYLTRTNGENSGIVGSALEEADRERQRNLNEAQAKAEQDRINKEVAYKQWGIEGQRFPAQVQSGMVGPWVSGANANLGIASSASANSPSFGDELARQIAEGIRGGAAATAKGMAG